MRRASLCLLLVFCLMLPCALADRPPVETLAVLPQANPLFASDAYTFRNEPFAVSACGPASVINAFNAALGVTDQQLAADIGLELLQVMTGRSTSETMDFNRLQALTALPDARYPTLNRIARDHALDVTYSRKCPTKEEIRQIGARQTDRTRLMLCSYNETNRYTNLCGIVHALYHTGHRDACVVLTLVSAGTRAMDCAFRTVGGHYVSLYLPVDEFAEKGTVYLLESFPRCLENETPGVDYGQYYDFVSLNTDNYALRSFTQNCRIVRITDAILRITPKGALSNALLMHDNPVNAAQDYNYYLTTMKFCSEGKLIIHIPGNPE